MALFRIGHVLTGYQTIRQPLSSEKIMQKTNLDTLFSVGWTGATSSLASSAMVN